jgi:ribosomal protein L16 Arg81 hydroxylase
LNTSSLPLSFWADFQSQYWEKKPGIFKQPFNHQFLSKGRLFDAIVGMPSRTPSDRFWASKRVPPQTRDDFQPVQLDQHGPRHQDKSLDGFFARVHQHLGGLPVGLNIHQLEKSQPELWFQFRDFVHALNSLTGELPSGRWDIDTFLGTYKTTPLGIHRDNASVFAICVMGKRTYYTWPGDYFKPGDAALSTLEIPKIQEHLDRATKLEVGTGDLVYWPSSNWHFVTSDGNPSAVISISAYFGNKLSEVISDHVKQLLEQQLNQNDFNRTYTMNEEQTIPPQQMIAALDIAKHALEDGLIAKAQQEYWLTYCSADGLHPVSIDNNARLQPKDDVSVDSRFPIIWKESGDNELLIAANGLTHSVTTQNNAVIINMLESLNSEESFIAEELVEKYSQKNIPAETIAKVLNTLYRFRAFNNHQ